MVLQISQQPQHCSGCSRLIEPGERYVVYGDRVLCDDCAGGE